MSDSETEGEAESEWQFNLDEVTEGGQERPSAPPIEPGNPSFEGVFFITLGVALTLVVFLGL